VREPTVSDAAEAAIQLALSSANPLQDFQVLTPPGRVVLSLSDGNLPLVVSLSVQQATAFGTALVAGASRAATLAEIIANRRSGPRP